MADPVSQRSALAGIANDLLRVEELTGLSCVNMRGSSRDHTFMRAVQRSLAFPLPQQPNTLQRTDRVTRYWLGPDEWFVTAETPEHPDLASALREQLAGTHFAVTDVTSGLTMLLVRGANAKETLAKGCTLDLDARVFRAGQCAQTLLAKAPVLIEPIIDPDGFRIFVRRSYARYLWLWLMKATRDAR